MIRHFTFILFAISACASIAQHAVQKHLLIHPQSDTSVIAAHGFTQHVIAPTLIQNNAWHQVLADTTTKAAPAHSIKQQWISQVHANIHKDPTGSARTLRTVVLPQQRVPLKFYVDSTNHGDTVITHTKWLDQVQSISLHTTTGKPLNVMFVANGEFTSPGKLDQVELGRVLAQELNLRSHQASMETSVGLAPGSIEFKLPDTAKVGVTFMASLDIRLGENDSLHIIGLTGDAYFIEAFAFSDLVTAELFAKQTDKLQVDPYVSGNVAVDTRSTSQWNWRINASAGGVTDVDLVISSKAQNGGVKPLPKFTKTVYIEPNVSLAAKNFWVDNWKWLFTTLLIPIFLYYRKKMMASKTGKPEEGA
ncbi:MAG TPA: hypothetical protein PK760_05925 [Flavobacteriales bacterium]|nr:hypothetical protein [Flavobacteriales bacterium]